MARVLLVLALVSATTGCPLGPGEEQEPPYDGFVGTWEGGESSGAQKTGTIRFQVTGTDIAGEVSPISGSQRDFTGNIEDGAILAVIPEALGGCTVTLHGTIAFANDGTGAGTASGTYTLNQSPHCNTNSGTWTATKAPSDG